MHLFGIRLDDREEYRNTAIEYKVGIAENIGENQTARKLLAQAIKSKKTFKSNVDPSQDTNG